MYPLQIPLVCVLPPWLISGYWGGNTGEQRGKNTYKQLSTQLSLAQRSLPKTQWNPRANYTFPDWNCKSQSETALSISFSTLLAWSCDRRLSRNLDLSLLLCEDWAKVPKSQSFHRWSKIHERVGNTFSSSLLLYLGIMMVFWKGTKIGPKSLKSLKSCVGAQGWVKAASYP